MQPHHIGWLGLAIFGFTPGVMIIAVNHAERVHAYYASAGLRLRAQSIQAPERAHFAVSGVHAGTGSELSSKARKKRRRQQERVAELTAAGKFIPLDDRARKLLADAHDAIRSPGELEKLIPVLDRDCPGVVVTASAVHRIGGQHSNETDAVCFASTAVAEEEEEPAECVVLPPHSSYVKSDVRELDWSSLGKFRLIVMDPPWENKSVTRRRCYHTFHHKELLKIDLPSVADDTECVVGIWVTNRPAYTSFIVQELLPAWGLAYHDTWYWLKICRNGQLVSPLEAVHRLPSEKLIVACRARSSAARTALHARLGATPKVVVSIPLRHSWKPPPECFFEESTTTCDGVDPHAPRDDDRRSTHATTKRMPTHQLEIFARELRPHWLSIGDDVLRFQHMRLYQCDSTSKQEST